jgi:4-nitrophenyl phosphatase
MADEQRPDVVLCDLDGVVWLAHQPIPGSVAAVARQEPMAAECCSYQQLGDPPEVQEATLARLGIPAAGDVTSAQAAALLLQPASGPWCAAPRDWCNRSSAGCEVCFDGDADAWSWGSIARSTSTASCATRVQRGAADRHQRRCHLSHARRPIPGGGSILAVVETACGRRAQVAGKPHEPMAAVVIAEVGEAGARAAVMVGDRPSTDGLFARTLGCRYAQVWSGVTPRGTAVDPLPDMEADDLAGVAEALVTGQYFRR